MAYKIIVNNKEKIIDTSHYVLLLSYEQIIDLAAANDEEKEHLFTITYQRAAGGKQYGKLFPGEEVWAKNGTIFIACITEHKRIIRK